MAAIPDDLKYNDDATWVLTSAFIIFTMQTGFGLLEAGTVGSRCEVNIMMKNAVDIIFGGLSYWIFGYGLIFGDGAGSNGFIGMGSWCVNLNPMDPYIGHVFSNFVFQLSFSSTATTIISGAMAERTKFTAYLIFSFVNTLIYSVPAHWIWADKGWLRQLGAVDIAGAGIVHLLGATSGLVATLILKPRLGRYDDGDEPLPMGNPANSIVGMFMLWWGWLAFNCGSTFGVSNGKWKNAAKSSTTSLNSAMGGGAVGLLASYFLKNGKYDVSWMVMSVLSGLAAITASCYVVRPWEAIIIGLISGTLTLVVHRLMNKFKIDDPVSVVATHGISGLWGLLATGLFANYDPVLDITQGRRGLFHGGGFYMLGLQCLMSICVIAWSSIATFIMLKIISMTYGLRMSPEEERLGADISEHGVGEVRQTVISDPPEVTYPTRPPTVETPLPEITDDNVFYRTFFPKRKATTAKSKRLFTITESDEDSQRKH